MNCDHETFAARVENDVAIVRLRKGALDLGAHLERKNISLSVIAKLEETQETQAILIFNEIDTLGQDAHRDDIHRHAQSSNHNVSERFEAEKDVCRKENTLDQYLLNAMQLKKRIISCLSGTIISPVQNVDR